MRDLPNAISFARILLSLPIMYLLMQKHFHLALWLFLVAGISDGLDGFLAKRYGWQSRLGEILDPLADKVLLMSSFLVLGALGLLPIWLVTGVILRDLVIVGGALTYHYRVEEFQGTPILSSKINTFLQILLVLAVIYNGETQSFPEWSINLFIVAVAISVLWSGTHYVWVWSRKAAREGSHQPEGWRD